MVGGRPRDGIGRSGAWFAQITHAKAKEKPCHEHSSLIMKFTLPSPVQKVLGILNFKLGPDVLPKSPILLAVSLIAFAAAVFLFQASFYTPARAAASAVGSAVLLAAVAMLCARISGYNDRLTQTLTALALGGAIVIFVRTALGFFMFINPALAELPDINVQELTAFLLFPLYVWNIFVFAFLFRRSFRSDVPISFAISIVLVFAVYFSVPLVFKSL
jgi:hypothetical protein